MSHETDLQSLDERCSKLAKHIEEQDTEIYRLSKRVDKLMNALQVQKMQVENLVSGGIGGADTMPANEKPPHYWLFSCVEAIQIADSWQNTVLLY